MVITHEPKLLSPVRTRRAAAGAAAAAAAVPVQPEEGWSSPQRQRRARRSMRSADARATVSRSSSYDDVRREHIIRLQVQHELHGSLLSDEVPFDWQFVVLLPSSCVQRAQRQKYGVIFPFGRSPRRRFPVTASSFLNRIVVCRSAITAAVQ